MGDDGSTVDDDVGDLPAWLEDGVAEADLPRDEFLDAITTVYRAAETDGATPPPASDDRVDDLESELHGLQDELDEKISDVRDRVLQVREMANADGDIDSDRITTIEDQHATIDAELEALDDRLEDLEATVDAGFENYESILNDLIESSRRHNARLDTLARVTRSNRDTLDRVAGEQSERTRMEDLAEAANRVGVRTARCEACGGSVDIALLTRPDCPDCGTTFVDVEPATGFFGSATLQTGSPPALAPGESRERTDPIEDMETDPTND